MKKLLLSLVSLMLTLNICAATKQTISITVNGKSRSMIVYTPTTKVANMPLMIVTHGMGQSPEYQSVGDDGKGGDRLWELSDTAKFVVAYLRSDGNMWDTGGTKDIDFVNQTIDEMASRFSINQSRIYWSGFSMGSMFIYATIAMINTNEKARKLVDRIAAFAPTSGYQFGATPWNALTATNKKINLIHHHSEGDTCFYWDGHNQNGQTPTWYITKVAEANGGTYSKIAYSSKEGNYTGTKEIWKNTLTGNVIEFFHYTQGGHWPSYYNRKEIWNFCRRFSLSTPAEEFDAAYKQAKTIVDTWATNTTVAAKTQYKNLVTLIDKYSEDNIDKTDEKALATATSNLVTKINAFNTYIATYKPNGKLTSQPSTFDPNFHIYLCFGQSNMEGNAAIEPEDRVYVDPRFKMMAPVTMSSFTRVKGMWYTAYPPLCRNATGLTPADYFGREMVANLPDSISVGVINVAVGGASIKLFDQDECAAQIAGAEQWFKNYCAEYGNKPYERLVECAKKAQQVGVIKGILLHQGCTDNGQRDWPVRVKRVYQRLLKDLGLNEEETPLIVGELLQQSVGGACWGHNSVIAHITDAIPNAYVVSSDKCPAASDGLHFTAEGYRMIGKRYAQKMLSVLGQTKEIDFDTTETPFPLVANGGFNSSLYMQGTFKGGSTIAQYQPNDKTVGFGGWRYSKGLDISGYKYLVINLVKSCTANPLLKIFDTDDYLNPCYSLDIKGSKKFVVELKDLVKEDGTPLDLTHINMLGFYTNGASILYLSSVFLSNDGETTDIELPLTNTDSSTQVYYDLTGKRVENPTKGIYIINNKKVYIDK